MSMRVIEAVNLGKKYHIGALKSVKSSAESEDSTGESRGFWGLRRSKAPTFWALKDISFSVDQAEVVGVIGHNGAGKSTLLKILTRITWPSAGYVRIRGRVGSLLEVGTGFQGMLTGRENVYLSGAILGMRKKEIDRKFDEIVEFAGFKRFIDTPVRHYSSGMYLRLAFAVAAHLEPDILLVDEVLAVGDAAFQKKCLDKMHDVTEEGRTVVFVSHNMMAVQQLCKRGILLEDGRIVLDSDVDTAIAAYLEQARRDDPQLRGRIREFERSAPMHGQAVRIVDLFMLDDKGQRTDQIKYGDKLRFVLDIEAYTAQDRLVYNLKIMNMHNVHITTVFSEEHGQIFEIEPDHPLRLIITLDEMVLARGTYEIKAVSIGKLEGALLDRLEDVFRFDILPLRVDETIPVGRGLITPTVDLQVEKLNPDALPTFSGPTTN
jgi:lipopolysaccharide transport system ATP-binding protein